MDWHHAIVDRHHAIVVRSARGACGGEMVSKLRVRHGREPRAVTVREDESDPAAALPTDSADRNALVVAKLLHIAHVIANRHRRPGLPLEVRRRREMVGMDVCVENPLDGQLLLSDISQNGISAPRRRPTRPLIEIEYRVDDRAFRRGGIGDDILDAGRPGSKKPLTVGRCFPRRAIHCSATVRSKPNLSPNGRMSSGFIRLSSTSPIA